MLIRDPIYISTLIMSPNHYRRARQWLNVKLPRGDRLQRRFLTRLEMTAFGRRFRLDLRTSDWPAWIATMSRHRVPARWRGTPRERQIRDVVIDVVQRATETGARDYDRWSETLQRLHHQALEGRLRGMALSELHMLLGEEG